LLKLSGSVSVTRQFQFHCNFSGQQLNKIDASASFAFFLSDTKDPEILKKVLCTTELDGDTLLHYAVKVSIDLDLATAVAS
jgi:hypothetical protein